MKLFDDMLICMSVSFIRVASVDKPHNVVLMKKVPTKRSTGGIKKERAQTPKSENVEEESAVEKKSKVRTSRENTRKAASKCSSDSLMKRSSIQEDVEEEGTQRQKTSSNRHGGTKKKTKGANKISPEVENAVNNFMDFVEKKGAEGLGKEFEELMLLTPADFTYDAYSQNKERNRFPDVVCIDTTRVILKNDTGNFTAQDTDYIHANWITLECVDRKFIATQGPMPNTIEDFWHMCFQETAAAVVCVTKFVESEIKKCEEYWPMALGGYATYGRMFINCKRVDKEDKFEVYTLEVLPEGCSNSHITKLIHVTGWPDGNVPTSGRLVLRILKAIKDCGPGPAVVHCSAGIGRTGTILAIEAVTTRLFKGKDTTVPEVFTSLRNQRASSIQTKSQYLFVYSTTLDYIKAKIPKHCPKVTKFYQELEKL